MMRRKDDATDDDELEGEHHLLIDNVDDAVN